MTNSMKGDIHKTRNEPDETDDLVPYGGKIKSRETLQHNTDSEIDVSQHTRTP